MTITQYLTNLCEHSGIDPANISVEESESDGYLMIQLNVPQEDSGLFIGFHGDTLNSLQRLVRVVFQDQYPELKIVLNVNDYKQQRADKLHEMAASAAERVLSTKQPYRFSYLPSNERFVIHSFFSDNPDYPELESFSEGEGSQRYLVVRLKQAA